jgi:acyl-CoA thioesterase-1
MSISGETTAGGLARIDGALAEHAPDIVVLELGGNDGLQGIPVDAIADNLRQMIARISASAATAVLVGMRIPPNYGPYYADAFERIYSVLSESEGIPVVDFLLEGVALQPGMMQEDGIHPTQEGQPQMLDNVWPVLQPLLASPVDTPKIQGSDDRDLLRLHDNPPFPFQLEEPSWRPGTTIILRAQVRAE